MKLAKMSLVAALALATTIQADTVEAVVDTAKKATDSMKFDGQLKFWYQTMDHGGLSNGQSDKGLFQRDPNQPNEWGNVEAQISVSGNANDHIKYKATLMTVTTFGMDAAITARPSQFGASNGYDAQPFWLHEGYIDYALGKKTGLKVGRMELDTPLIYTEKWNATSNSFEAITATNTDLPNTTILAGWISKGNGATDNLLYAPQVFGAESKFSNFMGFTHRTTTTTQTPVLGAGGIPTGDYIEGTTTSEQKIADGGALFLGAKNNSLSLSCLFKHGHTMLQMLHKHFGYKRTHL